MQAIAIEPAVEPNGNSDTSRTRVFSALSIIESWIDMSPSRV